MKLRTYIISILTLFASCINIAPDEQWDNDDTRIWIKFASSLDLPVNSFTKKDSTQYLTILNYEEKYEDSIKVQIINSPHFNKTTAYNPNTELWKLIAKEKLMGIWCKMDNGYRFLQVTGNQYPMTIIMDTVKDRLIIK
jgi:hypothetical protein